MSRRGDGSPPRALLIAPDEALASALAASPSMDLCTFERAAGDADAVRILRRRAIDVVLTSPASSIPEDLALLGELRRARPGVRVIILAPEATPADVIAALRARVFACFTAPFVAGEVAEMIRLAVQNPNGEAIEIVAAQPNWISLRVNCARVAADRLVSFFETLAADVPEADRDGLLLAFREILLNAMEHGAGFDADQVVEVAAVRTLRTIVYYVKDPGAGFQRDELTHTALTNPEGAPLAHVDERDRLGLRPGGFGILLAKNVVNELMYSERGNEVLMIKHIV
jgi:anti-sigma regulatory factor (Ser/Thr protein kinase)